MIKKLKRRFILNALVAFAVAMLALVVVLNLFMTVRFNDVLDYNLDSLMDHEVGGQTLPNDPPNPLFRIFMSRFFIVYYDDDGNVTSVMLQFEETLTIGEIASYAETAISNDGLRGWTDDYRYLKNEDGTQNIVIFVDGEFFTYALSSFRSFSLIALGITTIAVTAFLFLTANRAIKPTLESYELQRQFITDASHELKTPLSVIMANTEILADQDPDNEWLISIQKQTKLLTNLINQIVKLSKMDESELLQHQEMVNFSLLVQDLVDDFQPVTVKENITSTIDIESDLSTFGERQSLTELVKVLIDNAVKYCDENGEVTVTLKQNKHLVLTVMNTYDQIEKIDFKKIFNRFYRMDSARKSDGSFGLGLSIAKSIATIHHGSLIAEQYDQHTISFTLTLPVHHTHNV